MEYDDDMRITMEPLLPCLLTHVGVNTFRSDCLVPRDHQSQVLFQNAKAILISKRPSILTRWQKFFENSCLKSLCTHEMYLRYVLFACSIEIRFSDNIFDGILSVFALIVNFNIETLINSSVNFCELSVDIFMAFYKCSLKEPFNMNGGFAQFAKYLLICNERRLLEKYNLQEQIKKDVEKFSFDPNSIEQSEIIGNNWWEYLAKEILSTTRITLPPLINLTDVAVRLQAARQRRALLFDIFSKRQISGSDSKSKMTTASSKCKTVEAASIDGTSEKELMRSSTDVEVGSQAARQREKLLVATFSKRQASDTSLKTKGVISSKRKAVEVAHQDETLRRESKRNSTDVEVRLKAERQQEELPISQRRDTDLKNEAMTSFRLKTEDETKDGILEKDSIQNSTDAEVRFKAPIQENELLLPPFLHRESGTVSSKLKTGEEVSENETHESKRNSTDVEVKPQTVGQREEFLSKCHVRENDKGLKKEAMTFIKVETEDDETKDEILKKKSMQASTDVEVRLDASAQGKEIFSKRQASAIAPKNEISSASYNCIKVEAASKDETQEGESHSTASEIKKEIKSTKSSQLVEIISWKQCMILAKNLGKHQKHIEWLETIAETHNKYINSKCSDTAHANSRFHKEADKLLQYLKDMINTLVDALEDCDEE